MTTAIGCTPVMSGVYPGRRVGVPVWEVTAAAAARAAKAEGPECLGRTGDARRRVGAEKADQQGPVPGRTVLAR
jgi:hypothetical protein